MKKKVFAWMLALALAATGAACGTAPEGRSSEASSEIASSQVESSQAAEEPTSSDEEDASPSPSEEPNIYRNVTGWIEGEFHGLAFQVPRRWRAQWEESAEDGVESYYYYYPPTSETSMIMIAVQRVDNQDGIYSFSDPENVEFYLSGIADESSGLDSYEETSTKEFDFAGQAGFRHVFSCEIEGERLNGVVTATDLPTMVVSVDLYYSPDLKATESLQLMGEYDQMVDSFDFSQTDTSASMEGASRAQADSGESPTDEQAAALSKAFDYLGFTAFSYTGLIDQLEFEGFSTEDATWAADNCEADWEEQALQCAKEYLDFTAFSHSGLIEQLEFEGFTSEQAAYGTDHCGADWMEQAAEKALEYLDSASFSRQELIDQLLYEGFTQEQAEHGATQAGL